MIIPNTVFNDQHIYFHVTLSLRFTLQCPISCVANQYNTKYIMNTISRSTSSFFPSICELCKCFYKTWIYQDKDGDRTNIHARCSCTCIYMCVCTCMYVCVCMCVCTYV